MLIASTVVVGRLDYSWLAHDDGTLALAAQRVLAGEWPHVDFETPYSGGLAFFNALLLSTLGSDIFVLRIGLVAVVGVTLLFVGRVLAWHASAALVIGVISVATAWSIGIYPTPMPSWYQVFLGLSAAAGYLRFIRTGRGRYLVLAGLLAGVSVIVKVTGVFTIAALLVAIGASVEDRRLRWALVAAPVVGAVFLVSEALSWQRAVVLLLPILLVAFVALRRVAPVRPVTWEHVGIVAVSAGVPVAVFLAASAMHGDITHVLEGWFVTPRLRYDLASSPAAGGLTGRAAPFAAALPLLLIAPAVTRWASWIGLAALTWLTLAHWSTGFVVTMAITTLAPLMVGLVLLRRRSVSQSELTWAVMLVFTALLAFPSSDLHYALYLVPVAAAAGLGMLNTEREAGQRTWHARQGLLVVFVFLGLFLVGHARGAIYRGAVVVSPPADTVRLDLPTASLEVERADGFYNELVPQVLALAGDRPIYAGPDLPHVVALTALDPVAPVFFDFLTSRFVYDDLPDLLAQAGAKAVVINLDPEFSPPIPPSIREELERDFPMAEEYGAILLRWKEV